MIKTSFSGGRQLASALKKEVKKLQKMSSTVLVGYPETTGNNDEGTSIVMVAAVHEFGSGDIPKRPTLRTGVDLARRDIVDFIEEQAALVVDGDADAGSVMVGVGAIAQASVQQRIVDLKSPALKKETIRRRKNRSSNPLVDTGEMKGAVTFIVTNDPPTEGL